MLAADILNLLYPGAPHPVVSHETARKPLTINPLTIYIQTYVTGYNTGRSRTNDAHCIAASGANICGRRDTVACPPFLKFGTVVQIDGKRYVCEDRTARKFRGRFDINCDKKKRCPYEVTGWKMVKLLPE
jgi:hypothetical protein